MLSNGGRMALSKGSSGVSVPLWVRLGVPIALIIALSIGLISFLNYFNYQKTYRQLSVSRVLVIGRDLRQAVEAGLNFGMAPKSNVQLETALSLAKYTTDGLDFALVTDESGERLAGAGSAAPLQDWRARLAGIGKEPFWKGDDADTYQVGLPYRNNFGVTVGAVVLGYNKSAIDQATSAMRFALLIDWLEATALFSLLTLFGVWALTRRIESELAQAKSALAGAPDDPLPALHLPLLGPEIEMGIPELNRQARAAADALAAAEHVPA
jgi:sensor histidine kinase regulating citrate/malate metabolism